MKVRDWRAEVEAIDGELCLLLERRAQIITSACAGDYARAAARQAGAGGGTRARRSQAGALYASQPHPEAHVAVGDLP
jgi:hypothetical protein